MFSHNAAIPVYSNCVKLYNDTTYSKVSPFAQNELLLNMKKCQGGLTDTML